MNIKKIRKEMQIQMYLKLVYVQRNLPSIYCHFVLSNNRSLLNNYIIIPWSFTCIINVTDIKTVG